MGLCTWPVPLSGHFCMNACTAICLNAVADSQQENSDTQSEREKISSLVFIFIFYMSLNVQRASC